MPRKSSKPTKQRQPVSALWSDKKITRDAAGRVRIGGKFASKKDVAKYKATRKRRGLGTRIRTVTAKPIKKGKAKKQRKVVTLATEIGKRFRNRSFEFVKEETYTEVAGTTHRFYQVDTRSGRLDKFLKQHGRRKANLVLQFIDNNGEEKYISTPTSFADETEKLEANFSELVNRYNAMKEIAAVVDVQVDVWDKTQRMQ